MSEPRYDEATHQWVEDGDPTAPPATAKKTEPVSKPAPIKE